MRPSTVEPLWRLWVSEKHLDHYVGEATWRYNRREGQRGDQVDSMLAATEGKRLRSNELIK
jgi:hypothetical protein